MDNNLPIKEVIELLKSYNNEFNFGYNDIIKSNGGKRFILETLDYFKSRNQNSHCFNDIELNNYIEMMFKFTGDYVMKQIENRSKRRLNND